MGCNDFKNPTSDAPIQKYNAPNTNSRFTEKREIQTETQRTAKANYRLNRTLANCCFGKSSEVPAFNPSLFERADVQAQPYRRGDTRGKAFMGGGWAMACPKPPKAII